MDFAVEFKDPEGELLGTEEVNANSWKGAAMKVFGIDQPTPISWPAGTTQVDIIELVPVVPTQEKAA